MKRLMALAMALALAPVVAAAQDAIPQLKGTWKGTGKILLFGTTEHLSGSPQNAACATSRSPIRSSARTAG